MVYPSSDLSWAIFSTGTPNVQSIFINIVKETLTVVSGSSGLTSTQVDQLKKMIFNNLGDSEKGGAFYLNKTYFNPGWGGEVLNYASITTELNTNPNQTFVWDILPFDGTSPPATVNSITFRYLDIDFIELSSLKNTLFTTANQTKKSNLYAERIFSQHPLALWPLDDDISYIQLFDEDKRQFGNIYNWSISNSENITNTNYDATTNNEYPGFGIKQTIRTNYAAGNGLGSVYTPSTRGTATVSITGPPKFGSYPSLQLTFENVPSSTSKNGLIWGSFAYNLSSGQFTANTEYILSTYIRQVGIVYGNYRIRVSQYDSSDNLISETVIGSRQLSVVDDRWYRLYGSFISAPNASYADVDLETDDGKGQVIYTDGMMFEKANVVLPFFEDISLGLRLSDYNSGGGILNNTSPTVLSYFDTGTPNIRITPTASSSYIQSLFSIDTASASYSDNFDENKSTACFSTYVYIETPLVTSFEIGINYDSTKSSTVYNVNNKSGWVKLSHTFIIPKNTNITFFINSIFDSVFYNLNEIQFAGVSFGQWSENYNSYNIGYEPLQLTPKLIEDNVSTSIINNSSEYSYREADSYGTDTTLNGLYLIKNKEVYAETYGVPMVFGSTNTTKIYEADDNNPSIIFPGQGFLNESGKYNSYTFEAWIRLDNLSITPRRIIGPTTSLDGVYVEEGFISLKVADYSKSYFVGKWYRPMLLNVVYTPSSISLFINGSRVISISISTDNLSTFPIKEYDWIGIYGSDFINPFEIDCISICPYIVPDISLKKRFVYGQGTGEIKISNNEISANTALIDYSASRYATNVIYPDVSKWSDGFGVNTQSNSTYMTTPEYTLPEIKFSNNSFITNESDWLRSNYYYNINGSEFAYPYIVMNPSDTNTWSTLTSWEDSKQWSNTSLLDWGTLEASHADWYELFYDIPLSPPSWSSFESMSWGDVISLDYNNSDTYNSESTIYYKSINTINEDIASISGVFSTTSSSSSYQSLMYFKNNITNDYFDIYVNNASVVYSYNSNTLYSEYIGFNKKFVAGLNINKFTTKYFSIVKNFFDNPNIVSLNIGGLFNNSFTGKIYAIHFSNNFFYDKDLVSYFDTDQVFVKQSSTNYLINYTANYSLLPILYNSTMVLDIGTSSYWEDYQPLSYFGKYVKNSVTNSTYYDLDMMQFNADIPNIGILTNFTYRELKDMYITYEDIKYDSIQSVVAKKYSELKTSGPLEYESLELDTGINMYMSFHKAEDVGKTSYKTLTSQSISSNKVIEFNSSSYLNKKYEILNGTVIIPPKYPDFQKYYVGLHIEYKVRGINSKKLYIRRMELASLAYDEDASYTIGTRYGEEIYPFTRDNETFINKANNPFTIYKNSSPYLYLTDDSGIYINDYPLSASLSASANRGAYLNINSNKQEDFELAGIQFWCRYPDIQMPLNEFKIASIVSQSRIIDIWAQPESTRERLKIYAKENNEIVDCIFYLDGSIVQNPYIATRTWSSVAISLKDIFDLSNTTARLELYSGLLYNTISTYKYLSQIVGVVQENISSWYDVTSVFNPSSLWSTIESVYPSWASFPTTNTKVGAYAINADKIYNSSVGLANIVHEDLTKMTITSNGVDTFTDVELQLIEVSPV